MPDPITLITGVAAGVTVAKTVGDVMAPCLVGALSGQFHTQRGGTLMDDTIDILTDPAKSGAMEPKSREQYLQDHQLLMPVRKQLDESTKSRIGSLLNVGTAKKFHAKADKLYQKTKTDSDSARSAEALSSLIKDVTQLQPATEAVVRSQPEGTVKQLVEPKGQARQCPTMQGESSAVDSVAHQEVELMNVNGHYRPQEQDRLEQLDWSGYPWAAEASLRVLQSPGRNNNSGIHPLA